MGRKAAAALGDRVDETRPPEDLCGEDTQKVYHQYFVIGIVQFW